MCLQASSGVNGLACVGSARLGFGSTKLGVGLSDTNMLVSPMQNGRLGGLNQCDGPTQTDWRRSGI